MNDSAYSKSMVEVATKDTGSLIDSNENQTGA